MNLVKVFTNELWMEAEIEADSGLEALAAVREMIEGGEAIGGTLRRGGIGRKNSLMLIAEGAPYTLTTEAD